MFYRIELYQSQDTSQDTSQKNKIYSILSLCKTPKTRKEIQEYIGMTNRAYFNRALLNPLLDSGHLKMTIPEKPNSRFQKYFTTDLDYKG